MRLLVVVVAAGLSGFGVPAVAACYEDDQAVVGVLESVPQRASKRVSNYLLSLPRPICVQATDLDGVPTRIERVRKVQIMASDRAGEEALGKLVGSEITVLGHFDVPDRTWQIGDAVLSNAELVAVAGEELDDPDIDTGMAYSQDEDPLEQPDDEQATGYDSDPNDGFDDQAAIGAEDGSLDNTPYSSSKQRGASQQRTAGTYSAEQQRHRWQRQRSPEQREIEQRIVAFVETYYLGSGEMSLDEMRAVYANRVDYYGKRNVRLSDVLKDKQAYMRRWPERQFDLVPGTMEVRRMNWDEAIYDISYVYDFYVRAPGREKSGRGYTRLTIDLNVGRGKVVREAGKVIMRDN